MGDQDEEKRGEGQEQKATTPERSGDQGQGQEQGQDHPALAPTFAGPRAPDRRHRHLKEILGITSRPRPAQS